jgi:hypothetical protein
VKDEFSAPIVAAIINNQIHELTYPIEIESNCQPVTMDTADGARIYRRSLVFSAGDGICRSLPKRHAEY